MFVEPTARKPATWRFDRWRPAACSSAAASRRRFCRRSTDGRFMRAFRDKAPFDSMLARMPVKVILNAEAGLLGAAVYAAAAEHVRFDRLDRSD